MLRIVALTDHAGTGDTSDDFTEDSSSDATSSEDFAAPNHRRSVSSQSQSSNSTPLKDAWVDNLFSKYDGIVNLPAVESDAALHDTMLSTIVQELSARKMRRP